MDEVFKWMGAKVTGPTIPGSSRRIGDFLVIRATGTNAYNSYIDQLVLDLDSVATLIIPDLAAALHPSGVLRHSGLLSTRTRQAGVFIAISLIKRQLLPFPIPRPHPPLHPPVQLPSQLPQQPLMDLRFPLEYFR